MTVAILVIAAVFAALAVFTQVRVAQLEKQFPPTGQFVDVNGGRLHYIDIGPRDAAMPIVLVHGASSSLLTMQKPVGDMLSKNHRVITFDRPGLGWSTRAGVEDCTPAIQGRMIDEALGRLGVERAIIVGHSWAGALMPEMALNYPRRVAGIVMLSPVAYPWPGGVGTFNKIATIPLVGPLLAYTLTVPLGTFLLEPGVRFVFSPQAMPDGYVEQTAVPLVLRPRTFLNNAWDLDRLKPEVENLSPRYGEIKIPVTLITGDTDNTVSPKIHSLPFANNVKQTKLIVLPGVGHMTPYSASDIVLREIEAMAAQLAPKQAAAK